jgi:predicted transcriptional regulator
MTVYCERMVRYVVPALRMLISRQLLEKYSLNQVQVAKLLNVTQPSISNYTGRRKSSAKIRRYLGNSVVNEYAESMARKLFEKGLSLKELEEDVCSLCAELRKGGYLTG